MPLPPIAPPPAAAARLQPRRQPQQGEPLAPAKPPRRGRGAPPPQQQPRSRVPPGGSSNSSAATALSRGRSVQVQSPAARGEASSRFPLSLPPEAVRLLQRRSLERQQQQQQQAPRSTSPEAPARPLAGVSCPGGDLRALLRVSLLNEHRRYDDVEYEEEEEGEGEAGGAPPADEALVRKCTEWLRGVESAAARDRAGKLDTLPHLSTL